jgi:microcystin degradation protein MlrC
MSFRIAIGALLFEGNTFSPVVTGVRDFHNKYFHSGQALVRSLRGGAVEMSGAISVLETANSELVPLFATHGGSGGRVSAVAYKKLRENLLSPLRAAGHLDGLYLGLHGAFLSQGIDDVEGDILEAARSIVGKAPIVISCDLHAHVTPTMTDLADMIIGYQHYPHDDARQTGERAAKLLLGALKGEIKPVMAVRKAPMIVPPPNSDTHGGGPMSKLNQWAREKETQGVALAISYFPVQPWLDLADVGFSAAVITNDDPEGADGMALQLCKEAWRRRHEFDMPLFRPNDAIRRGLAIEGGPVILSDTADCVGGGGSGDSAVVLRALLESRSDAPAVMLIVDPETVRQSERAGVGRRFHAFIGNKVDSRYGEPVEVEAEVIRLFDGQFSYTGGIMAGPATMGPSAVIRVGPVNVVVSTYSSYEYADEQFLAAGVDPRHCKFVVVKNPMNYKAAYEYARAAMLLDTPGPTSCNLAALPWQHMSRPRFPLDDDFQPEFV